MNKYLEDSEFEDFVVRRRLSENPFMEFILKDGTAIPEDCILEYLETRPAKNVGVFIIRRPQGNTRKVPLADIQGVFLLPEGQHVLRQPQKSPIQLPTK